MSADFGRAVEISVEMGAAAKAAGLPVQERVLLTALTMSLIQSMTAAAGTLTPPAAHLLLDNLEQAIAFAREQWRKGAQ